MTRAASLFLWLAFAVTAAPQAAAEEDPAREAARQRFQDGAAAYQAGRFKDAIDLFLEADRLSPNPAFAYNIGLAYEELGDAPNALKWYRDYLRALPDAADRELILPRIAAAEHRLRGRGVQQVTILSEPDAATVALDGRRVGVTPWSGELAPGRHRVVLELPGHPDTSQLFELPSDHAIDVRVSLAPSGGSPPAEAPRAAPPPSRGRPRPASPPGGPPPTASVRPLTWVALGVGAAGFATAFGFELARSSTVEEARGGTNLNGAQLYDEATRYQTGARVALGVGVAAAAAGGVLLYLDVTRGARATESAPAVRASMGCPAGRCGLSFDGTF